MSWFARNLGWVPQVTRSARLGDLDRTLVDRVEEVKQRGNH